MTPTRPTQQEQIIAPTGRTMELILPTTFPITIGAIIAFLTLFASIIGVYVRLGAQLDNLQMQFGEMTERNKHADAETESVKKEQAEQKTTVAVMAVQITNMGSLLERIDRNVDKLTQERH